MLRQIVLASLLYVSLGLIPVAYRRHRFLGALTSAFVGLVAVFALTSSTRALFDYGIQSPFVTASIFAGLILLFWAMGPGSATWRRTLETLPANRRAVAVGLGLFATVAVVAWLTIPPRDYANEAYERLEADLKAHAQMLLQQDIPPFGMRDGVATFASKSALDVLRTGINAVRAAALTRLTQMSLEASELDKVRREIDGITAGSAAEFERQIQSQTEEDVSRRAAAAQDVYRSTVASSVREAVSRALDEALLHARAELRGRDPEVIAQSEARLLAQSKEMLTDGRSSTLRTSATTAAAPARIEIATAAAERAADAARTAVAETQRKIASLFDRLTSTLQAAKTRAETEKWLAAAKAVANGLPNPLTLPPALPGGPERPYDVLGMTTGMNCDAATSVVRAQAADRGAGAGYSDYAGKLRLGRGANYYELDVRYLKAHVVVSDHTENLLVTCSTATAFGQIISITRRWLFTADNSWPTVTKLKADIENKYGRFGSEFVEPGRQSAVFANLYGPSGKLSGRVEHCGRFLYNTPEAAVSHWLDDLDVARCSYLQFAAFQLRSGDYSRVAELQTSLWDYARLGLVVRFAKMVGDEVQQRTSSRTPKL